MAIQTDRATMSKVSPRGTITCKERIRESLNLDRDDPVEYVLRTRNGATVRVAALVTSKTHQVCIPVGVRDSLDIEQGDVLHVEWHQTTRSVEKGQPEVIEVTYE